MESAVNDVLAWSWIWVSGIPLPLVMTFVSELAMLKNGSSRQPVPVAVTGIAFVGDGGFIESGMADATDLSDKKTGLFLIGTPTGSSNRGASR
jgi:hypothetical protein